MARVAPRFRMGWIPAESLPKGGLGRLETAEGRERGALQQESVRTFRDAVRELGREAGGLGEVPETQAGDRQHPERGGVARVCAPGPVEVGNRLFEAALRHQPLRRFERILGRRGPGEKRRQHDECGPGPFAPHRSAGGQYRRTGRPAAVFCAVVSRALPSSA